MSTTGEVIQRLRTASGEPRNGEPRNGDADITGRENGGNGNVDQSGDSPESKRAHHDAPLQEGGDRPRKDGAGCATRTKVSMSRHLNDFYHSLKIVKLHGSDIHYCKRLGGFLRWAERRWVADETGYVWQWAVHTALKMYREGDGDSSAGENSRIEKWALRSLSRRRIEDALKHLETEIEVVTTADEYDRDQWLFNVKNGTIDLRTGRLREHRREDLITKIAPVEFNPAGERPRLWEEFLAEIFGGDCALMDFVQRACGYALTGSVSEQKLFFLYGSGANGKTTFLETLMFVMGDYARRIAPSLLFAHSRDMHPTGLADLKGSRLAVTTEVEFGKRLAEAAVKELTGGDRLTARRMRQDSFEFEPTHKVFMCGNHLPIVRGTDHAIWRRIVLIPFGVTIPEERQDKDLCGKLHAEAAGILNWLVTGCLEWQKKGLGEPSAVLAATGAYRSDMDVLGAFLSDCCVLKPNVEAKSADINIAYREWCEKNGENPMSVGLVGLRLKERGLKQKRTMWARMWQGICLKEKDA